MALKQVKGLKCTQCGKEHTLKETRYVCTACGANTEVIYDYEYLKTKINRKKPPCKQRRQTPKSMM